MDHAEYLNAIRQSCYQGEVGGEAFALRAKALEPHAVKRYKRGCLLQLETEALGIEVAEPAPVRRWSGLVREVRDVQMREVLGVADVFVSKFREIAAAAPPEDAALAESMVPHELDTFARRELAGEAETSVDDMVERLKFPLLKP
jgi:hypothetical protein